MASTRLSMNRPIATRAGIALGAFGLIGAIAVQPLVAQLTPLAGEFLVNSYTTNDQSTPNVAASGEGFVVSWISFGGTGGDNTGNSVQQHLYDLDGVQVTPQTQANSTTAGDQFQAASAAGADGRFLVVWMDTGVAAIRARRFTAAGATDGAEMPVQTAIAAGPDAAYAADHSFVLVWDDNGEVRYRVYNSSGGTILGTTVANNLTTGSQNSSAVAVADDGTFVIVWQSDAVSAATGGDPTDTDFSIQARRFNAAGTPLGNQFQVNSFTTGAQFFADVGITPTHEFVVTWRNFGSHGDPDFAVIGRRFDAAGTALGPDFRVNAATTGLQTVPRLAVDRGGSFVVAWDQGLAGGTQYTPWARAFDNEGNSLGGDVQVATTVVSTQTQPAVSIGGSRAVFAWNGSGTGDTDGIFARLYSFPLFADGFESNGLTRWSNF